MPDNLGHLTHVNPGVEHIKLNKASPAPHLHSRSSRNVSKLSNIQQKHESKLVSQDPDRYLRFLLSFELSLPKDSFQVGLDFLEPIRLTETSIQHPFQTRIHQKEINLRDMGMNDAYPTPITLNATGFTLQKCVPLSNQVLEPESPDFYDQFIEDSIEDSSDGGSTIESPNEDFTADFKIGDGEWKKHHDEDNQAWAWEEMILQLFDQPIPS